MDSWQWDYYENSTTLDGSKSWFKYEELIDDWLDLTVLEAGKRVQTLKNRRVGDEQMYKGLLNRELLRAENGVKYFRDFLRPTSSKELRVCSPGDLISLPEQEEETLRWSSGSAICHCS